VGRIRPWQLAALVVVLCAGALAVIFWVRTRPAKDVRSQLSRLPVGTGSIAYVDIATLRRSGIMSLLEQNSVAEEADYRAFVNATGFDWRQDLDTVMLAFRQDERFILATGRFDWPKISRYAKAAGGACENSLCRVSSTRADYTISIMAIRTGVLAMAVSTDRYAARILTDTSAPPRIDPPTDPAWLYLPKAALQPDEKTPAGLGSVLGALAASEHAFLSVGGTVAQIEVRLMADCAEPGTAEKIATRLQDNTMLLKNLIAREGKAPSEDDLSGVLTAGQFGYRDRQVTGRWPVARKFLEKIVQ